MKTLEFSEKQKISYCVSTDLRDEQIKINISKVSGRLVPATEKKNEPIAIVCFGPSLQDTWNKLKDFKYIMTCSGAHKFLIEKGIVPTWHVDLEPREHKIKMLGEPHPDVEYLIASTIHPRYLDELKGYNVKLWHIFANEEDGARVLPRGEWLVTGGSSVGLRCMTLSRLLGFTDLHIFGMDGSTRETGSHTTYHPNAPKESFETEYNGKKFLTTPSMLFCAKETQKELDQLPDVKATFYGDGLLQEIMKDYKPAPKRGAEIAYVKDELISKEYIELNRKLHQDVPTYGMGGSKHKDTVVKLMQQLGTHSVLDYGCGKGQLAKSLDVPIWEYDPAIPEKSAIPKPADIVICTDVLEHIEPDKLNVVLDDIKRCTKKVAYLVISTRKAVKTYSNGQNTHLIVQGKEWWDKKLQKFFNIGTIIDKPEAAELHIVVEPKRVAQPDIVSVERNGVKIKFYTPNDTTKWRANTVFTKEPSTIHWIDQMKKGEVLYDVGANVGSYSVYAAARGIKVYSFEPEAENFAMLVKNLKLNGAAPNAYCLAVSDEQKAGVLYAGQQEAGGACHSFNESIDYNLEEKKYPFTQGCFGTTLDSLVKNGLPHPQHIKVDVDGLEHKVINGASNVLANGLKTILVEVNDSLPQHREMIQKLCDMGFSFDEAQVNSAKRKEGTFKGVAEYVFVKNKEQKKYNLNCQMLRYVDPYPHTYVENFFPEELYKKMMANMPTNFIEIEKSRGTKGYPKRFTATTEQWPEVENLLLSGEFKKKMLDFFEIPEGDYIEDILLVRDYPGYAIPPHTDSLKKVITCLIYLPETEIEGEGTSIYVPKQTGFTCKTGQHYKFEDFDKVKTLPFRPNSMFAFARTDNSFHGVEPCSNVRNVLLYNINKKIK